MQSLFGNDAGAGFFRQNPREDFRLRRRRARRPAPAWAMGPMAGAGLRRSVMGVRPIWSASVVRNFCAERGRGRSSDTGGRGGGYHVYHDLPADRCAGRRRASDADSQRALEANNAAVKRDILDGSGGGNIRL